MGEAIQVVPYNPAWPHMFEAEATLLHQLLGQRWAQIHHVGSTSVPGLWAKPKIDIILEVKTMADLETALEKGGYECKGEYHMPFRLYFRKTEGALDVNLHAYEEGNPEIELNLLFRNFLRNSPKAREEYKTLKLGLISQQTSHEKNEKGFPHYTLQKDSFIKKILKETDFSRLRLVFCSHYEEWDFYHRVSQEQLFDPLQRPYNKAHGCFKAEAHFHFVLYRGATLVSIAHLEFLDPLQVSLRALALDSPFQKKGYGSHMLRLLERWSKRQGKTIMKLHEPVREEAFYKKQGYVSCPEEKRLKKVL
jgi:GrpB-like predicted nucleotidyltransferase (UPF0157 family)